MLKYPYFPSNVKYVKIRYNSVKVSLSDLIARLYGLLFRVTVVLLSLLCAMVSSTRTKLYFLQLLINLTVNTQKEAFIKF